MNIPKELLYTETHEWVRFSDDGRAEVGLTAHAAEAMGDLVYLELLEIGEQLIAGDSFGTLESVKASSELYSPLSGELISVNTEVMDSPEKITDDPYGCWLIGISGAQGKGNLLTADEYETLLSKEG